MAECVTADNILIINPGKGGSPNFIRGWNSNILMT
jgi:hypothetical protein